MSLRWTFEVKIFSKLYFQFILQTTIFDAYLLKIGLAEKYNLYFIKILQFVQCAIRLFQSSDLNKKSCLKE